VRADLYLILFAHTYASSATAARTIASGLRSGRLSRPAVQRSVERVLSLRRRAAELAG
jgi:hypothetical protein